METGDVIQGNVIDINVLKGKPKVKISEAGPTKTVERAGEGPEVTARCEVKLTQHVFGEDGQILNAYCVKSPKKFKTSDPEKKYVCEELHALLMSMRVGEASWVEIPRSNFTPDSSHLVFVRLELVSLAENKLQFNDLPYEEQLKEIQSAKLRGDQFMREKNFPQAEKAYLSAFSFFKGISKKTVKALGEEDLATRADLGLRLCKNLLRTTYHTENFPFADEIFQYANKHIKPEDPDVLEIYANVALKNGNPEPLNRLTASRGAPKKEPPINKTLGKALIQALLNEEEEIRREKTLKRIDIQAISDKIAF